MSRLVLFLLLALAACSSRPVHVPPPAATAGVLPALAEFSLQGRWTISSVNGRQVDGLWLELGGEGSGTVTRAQTGGLLVGSPLPRTRAHLGCNDWHPNGWTRDGGKLTLGTEMSHRTERGCDPARMALDDEAYAILHKAMIMDFTPPNRLRLVNENGALNLVRDLSERSATAFIARNIRPGSQQADAINLLVRGGFACRRLGRHEYGPTGPDGLGPKEFIMTMCHVAAEGTAEGYRLVYANLTANPQEQLVSVSAGSYPVVYRNLRMDSQGRVTVVRDPEQ